MCRSPHGERGLKLACRGADGRMDGRSPHGERGLKYGTYIHAARSRPSLSSWRAWIEIMRFALSWSVSYSRSPHGERGLK